MKPGNFLFMPDESLMSGTVYHLGTGSDSYRPNSFVVIPYSEPRLSPPAPVFYEVMGSDKTDNFITETTGLPFILHAQVTRSRYLKEVQLLKDHIQKGNIYEINYCIRFSATAQLDPLSLFLQLCRVSKAPYQMMAKLGDEYILCASPELFLQKQGELLMSKPIKGTIRRGSDREEDEKLRSALYNSHKDRTENVMAVDVARNDLSMVAQRGSVNVNRLYNIESFATVHQMVSTVSCRLRPEITFTDIISATFPMASMTGAPKEKAMELITRHEGFERSYYSGAMGLIDTKGDFTLPVLIRSVFYNEKSHEVWCAAGGAITCLSDPAEEYEECLLKTSAMLKAMNATLSA